jgi:sugar-specific transcriptional regulator TrmB
MDINEKLQEAGLTGNESKVYLELIKKGQLSANQLAKNLGIDRTLTYTILNHLIEKGQISYTIKENKKFFTASNPEHLLNLIKKKEAVILDLIKELNKIQTKEQQEINLNIYEGDEGLRSLFRLILNYKELVAFGGTGRAYELLYESQQIAKETKKRNIKIKLITNLNKKEHEYSKYQNIEIKEMPIKSEATTCTFGDYVSIHLLKDKPIIILIKNKDIAESYRNYFNFMWDKAK